MTNSDFFDISGDDVTKLNDTDLRELIGRLCEAEFDLARLPVSAIRYSGHQNAPDGGIDVSIDYNGSLPQGLNIPNGITGYQVKKSKMSDSNIKSEMKSNNKLKPGIKKLIEKRGTYIIVSSGSNTSDSEYEKRMIAMKEVIADEKGCENLFLDFYDQNRIASWLRQHPSIILWVKLKIGKPNHGWQPYDNWSYAPSGIEEEYIIDTGIKLYDDGNNEHSIENGISLLRQILNEPKKCIRLVGLSGTGKTRLVQALFDDGIGNDALNKHVVYYTDMSDDPNPVPKALADHLIALNKRAIVIVDNCGSELHSQVTKICLKPESQISLITIEYDVREDLPLETQVFKLDPKGEAFIEKFIEKYYPYISTPNTRTIASLSDGNARVAIVLADTLEKREKLNFDDETLFNRLFWQNNQINNDLLNAAQIFSLLYSFNGEETNENSDLSILGSLINKSASEIFGYVDELKRRCLLQSRGVWCAMLPHAIANRLASRALKSILPDKIENTLLCSDQHIIRTFTHRLHYLHDNSVAQNIVSKWLSPEGIIGKNISQLSALGITMLENIAPVCEDETLEIIEIAINDHEPGEWFASEENPHAKKIIDLLRHLAYDSKRFHKSAMLMAKFVNLKGPHKVRDQMNGAFINLFYIYFSGSHANIKDRSNFIKELLNSNEDKMQKIGLLALEAALKARSFTSRYRFEFGIKSRDYGFMPKTNDEIFLWYKTFIEICREQAIGDGLIAVKSRNLFANRLPELWNLGMKGQPRLLDIIEESVKSIKDSNGFWVAANSVLAYDKKEMSGKIFNRTLKFKNTLKPSDDINLARAYIIYAESHDPDAEHDLSEYAKINDGHQAVIQKTKKIAMNIAQDEKALQILLPEFLSLDGRKGQRLYSFGRGLSAGCNNKKALWDKLCQHLHGIPKEKRNFTILEGFVSDCGKTDPIICNEILDEILYDDYLGQYFPVFQIASRIDSRGIERLHECLKIGKSYIHLFSNIAFGRVHESINDNALVNLMEKIQKEEGGAGVVLDILSMRFFRDQDSSPHSEKLLEFGRNFLVKEISKHLVENAQNLGVDHSLSTIAATCIPKKGYDDYIKKLWYTVVSGKDISLWDIQNFISGLARKYPDIFLDMFLLNNENINDEFHFFILNQGSECLGNIDDDDLITWCNKNPHHHYPLMVKNIDLIEEENDNMPKWKSIFHKIIENTPDLKSTLNEISTRHISPDGWSGSLANILQQRCSLFDDFTKHDNEIVRQWAEKMLSLLDKRIIEEQEREIQESRQEHQTFE